MDEIRERFEILASTWEVETRHLSVSSETSNHPAYQAIIEMGEPVVPLILDRLRNKGINFWFIALERITGKNPVPDSHQGYPEAMTVDWLLWGLRQGMFRAV